MLPETMGGMGKGLGSGSAYPSFSPEEVDEDEEVKDDRESITEKLAELKLQLCGSMRNKTIIELSHFGEHKPVIEHKPMQMKGKMAEMPILSATPVNTLVDEEEDNPDPVIDD